MAQKIKPVALIILDGWGIAPPSRGNAIYHAQTPNFNSLVNNYPHATLQAAGEAVGLPWHKMGNSEVGHINMGSGRIMYQNLPRINNAIATGKFYKNSALLGAMAYAKQNNSNLHIAGLLSNGGVHSHTKHLYALLEMAKKQGLSGRIFVHAFLDGRDDARDSGVNYVQDLQDKIELTNGAKLASLSGRYYAMDRDNRWERIEKVYRALVDGVGDQVSDPKARLQELYTQNKFDEYIEPIVVNEKGAPITTIKDNDAVIFFNYRRDRGKQIVKSLVDATFEEFERKKKLNNLEVVTLTEYDPYLDVKVAFTPPKIDGNLGQVLAVNDIKQFRIAETEKYAHVTVFFNCGVVEEYPGEQRMLLSSPNVATYDEEPKMSAHAVTEFAIQKIQEDAADFYCINFANADMVGHTGNFEATVEGVESVDEHLGMVIKAIQEKDGVAIVTADHGNAEVMIDLKTGDVDKEHTANPVPFIIVGSQYKRKNGSEAQHQSLHALAPIGVLGDIAPTVLEIMKIKQPKEMTGISILQTIL